MEGDLEGVFVLHCLEKCLPLLLVKGVVHVAEQSTCFSPVNAWGKETTVGYTSKESSTDFRYTSRRLKQTSHVHKTCSLEAAFVLREPLEQFDNRLGSTLAYGMFLVPQPEKHRSARFDEKVS